MVIISIVDGGVNRPSKMLGQDYFYSRVCLFVCLFVFRKLLTVTAVASRSMTRRQADVLFGVLWWCLSDLRGRGSIKGDDIRVIYNEIVCYSSTYQSYSYIG